MAETLNRNNINHFSHWLVKLPIIRQSCHRFAGQFNDKTRSRILYSRGFAHSVSSRAFGQIQRTEGQKAVMSAFRKCRFRASSIMSIRSWVCNKSNRPLLFSFSRRDILLQLFSLEKAGRQAGRSQSTRSRLSGSRVGQLDSRQHFLVLWRYPKRILSIELAR